MPFTIMASLGHFIVEGSVDPFAFPQSQQCSRSANSVEGPAEGMAQPAEGMFRKGRKVKADTEHLRKWQSRRNAKEEKLQVSCFGGRTCLLEQTSKRSEVRARLETGLWGERKFLWYSRGFSSQLEIGNFFFFCNKI